MAHDDVKWTPTIRIVRGHVISNMDRPIGEYRDAALAWCERKSSLAGDTGVGVHRMPGPNGEVRYWIGTSICTVPIGPSRLSVEWKLFKSWLSRDRTLQETLDMMPAHVRAVFEHKPRSVWVLAVYK